jgi:hypothetical protein
MPQKLCAISKGAPAINILEKISVYLTLSSDGKKLLRSLLGLLKEGQVADIPSLTGAIQGLLNKNGKILYDCLLVSDRGFREFIPEDYLSNSGMTRQQAYYRLVKTSSLLLFTRSLFFSAFGISLDNQAKRRCVCFAFIKRIYDDLLDNDQVDPKYLFGIEANEQSLDKPEYVLLLGLRNTLKKVAPLEKFPNFYALRSEVHRVQAEKPTPENVKEVIFNKLRLGLLLDAYIMVNDLKDNFIEALSVVAEFFACLDDFYDLEEDRFYGRLTYINQCPDPEKSLREKYGEMVKYMRKHTPYPDKYIEGMESLLKVVIIARNKNLIKLSKIIK